MIIHLDGIIGVDVLAKDVRQQLEEAAGEDVTMEVSSGGGSVFEGLSLRQTILDYEGKTTARVVSLAASMASYVAVAADRVVVTDSAAMMLHNPHMLTAGDHRLHAHSTEVLERLTEQMAGGYARASGRPVADIREEMNDETWLFGEEAVTAGYADEVEPAEDTEDKAVAFARAREAVAQTTDDRVAALDSLDRVAAMVGPVQMGPGAKRTTRTSWPREYVELAEKHPRIAREAVRLADEHHYTLDSVCRSILQVREQMLRTGEQRERSEAAEAARLVGLTVADYYRYGGETDAGITRDTDDEKAAALMNMSAGEYRNYTGGNE